MSIHSIIKAGVGCFALGMLGLQIGCRDENPAFQRARDGQAPSSSSTLVDESGVDQTSTEGETASTSEPKSTDSAPTSSTSSSPEASTKTPAIQKSAFCQDEHALCFSMQSSQDGSVVEEQAQGLQFVHSNTTVTERDPDVDEPWDQLLTVSNYGDSASTAAEFSITSAGVLGVEVVAKELSCRSDVGFCPILAINGYLSINYNNDGSMECEARYQKSSSPSKIRVKLEAQVSPVRAVCWSDGASLMFWANEKFVTLADTGGLLPTSEPTELLIGGELNQLGYSSMRGSIALVRFWTTVDNLKAKLDADPEV